MQNQFQRTSLMKKHIENAVTSKEQRNFVPSAGPPFNCGLLNQERQVFLFIIYFRNSLTDMTLKGQAVSLFDGVGEQRWHSGESVRLQPRWPGFDSSSVPYVGWVSCCFSPCSQGFFSGFPSCTKTNISKLHFNQERGLEWKLSYLCKILMLVVF